MANNFSGDPNCLYEWRFENGALTTDSIGGQTLTAQGDPSADLVNYMEGAGSVALDGDDDYYRLDADLDANFPCKNGTSNNVVTVCAWWKNTVTNGGMVFGKYSASDNRRCFAAQVSDNGADAHKVVLYWGYSNGAAAYGYVIDHVTSTTDWVFLKAVWDDPNNVCSGWLWDEADSSITTVSGAPANALNIEDSNWYIGKIGGTSPYYFTGNIDDVIIFNRVVSDADALKIKNGTYGAGAGNAGIMTTNTGFWGPTYG
jgi:hypothetical protein